MICCTLGSAVSSGCGAGLPVRSPGDLLLVAWRLSRPDKRGHQDTRLIEQIQRHRLEHQRDRVARQERGDRRAGDDRVAAALAQLLDVTSPMRVAPRITTGTWNTRPIASSIVAANL